MANPIRPLGRSSAHDIYDEAATQDLERQIEEDELHFRNTGENRRPRRLDNPLVDNNPSPDIANDGDNYDLSNDPVEHTASGEYAEDSPSQFIPSHNSRRTGLQQTEDIIRDYERTMGNDTFSRNQHQRVGEQYTDLARERVMNAYNRREREKGEKEFAIVKEKRIEQSKNAILELKIEDDE